ncbi:hypothetical protein J4444_04165 [Candidatus Woesearchaeota archaeon]|nr:hypothetical protein [Candidatus Woesearchaeota archaeon]
MNLELPDGVKMEAKTWLYLHRDNRQKAALVAIEHVPSPLYALYSYN